MAIDFNRQPRIITEYPRGEVRIPNPPQAQSKPEISWFSIIVPPMVMLVITVLIALTMGSLFMMLSIAMTVMTLITSLSNAANQIRKFKKNKKKRESRYLQYVRDKRAELELARDKQKKAYEEMYPSPDVCLQRVNNVDSQLYEKTPVFHDFLKLRAGIGAVPMELNVSCESNGFDIDDDPLKAEPKRLAKDFMDISESPLVMDLFAAGICGIASETDNRYTMLNSMIVQLATHHGYDDIKLVVLCSEQGYDSLKWMRFLPHIWSSDGKDRFFLCGKASSHTMLSKLTHLLKQRKSNTNYTAVKPAYVFVIDDETLLEDEAISDYLYNKNSELGVFSIFVHTNKGYLPMNCDVFASLQGKKGELTSRLTNRSSEFTPDMVNAGMLEKFAVQLTSIKLKSNSGAFEIPKKITLNGLYDLNKTGDMDLLKRWATNRTYQGMRVPIGVKSGNKQAYLDLHETGHGPHGLVAGTTGSGKSELLQTIIISMSMNYHPHDIAFILIDYKGGGMADVFEGMPHVVGTITNLGGNQTTRALVSIKSEITRRQRVFAEFDVNSIDKYQKKYHSGKYPTMEPLPHLIMIADEFAELKQDQPEFMSELVSAARVGRSLGIHLILATQKPAGIVDDQIWSNSKFKICLKVQDTADSNDVLKKPDAAYIKEPGRAYLQVGNDEIYQLFQSAYSGEAYLGDGENTQAKVKKKSIYQVDLDGSIEKVYPLVEDKIVSDELPTQLDAMVSEIKNVAKSSNIDALEGPWSPPLLETLPMDVISEEAVPVRWNDEKVNGISIPIGMYDDPAQQSQGVFDIDFSTEGNLVVVGCAGSGKSHLLNVITTAAAMKYTNDELTMYGLDLGGASLRKINRLPICSDVVGLEDDAKIKYLIHLLEQDISEKKKQFAISDVNDIEEYKRTVGPMQSKLIMIDNYFAFSETYPELEETLLGIIREGLRFGIYFIITAQSPSVLRYRVLINFKQAMAFELTDATEYTTVIGRTDGMVPSDNKGRCLYKGVQPIEVQIADVDGTERSFSTLIGEINEDYFNKGFECSEALPVMEEHISISALNRRYSDSLMPHITIGKDFKKLQHVAIDLTNYSALMVVGDHSSHKSDVVNGWFKSLCEYEKVDKVEIYGADSSSMELFGLVNHENVVSLEDEDTHDDIIDKLSEELKKRQMQFIKTKRSNGDLESLNDSWHQILIIINGVSEFAEKPYYQLQDFIEKIIRSYRNLKCCVIGIDSVSSIETDYSGLAKAIKGEEKGILLGSIREQNLFGAKMPYGTLEEALMYNDGYLIHKAQYERVRLGL